MKKTNSKSEQGRGGHLSLVIEVNDMIKIFFLPDDY